MNIDKKALIGIITEIEASRERAKAETRHQSEILKKAKEQHFDTKAIRKVLQRRAMAAGERESLDIAIETYERAMGSLAAAQEAVEERRMSAREAAEHYGVPRGALSVVTGGSKTGFSSQPSHDADGVITETGGAAVVASSTDGGPAAVDNKGGRHEDVQSDHFVNPGRLDRITDEDESPAEGDKSATQDGGDHDRGHLTEESCGQPDGGLAEVGADGTVAAPSLHDTDHFPDARNMVESPATPSAGAVDDAGALSAMEEAGQRLRQMRAERGL